MLMVLSRWRGKHLFFSHPIYKIRLVYPSLARGTLTTPGVKVVELFISLARGTHPIRSGLSVRNGLFRWRGEHITPALRLNHLAIPLARGNTLKTVYLPQKPFLLPNKLPTVITIPYY